ncbi:MAG TPA: EAL domain-containing protein [Sphingobium sp.]|nr:EAL domain-containing protein [Sphingobium sp.]
MKRTNSKTSSEDVAPSGAPSVFAMMGITKVPAPLAEQLYVAQFKATDRLGGLRLTMGIVSIVFVVIIYWGFAPNWMLAAWSLVAAVSVITPIASDLRRRKNGYADLSRIHILLDGASMLLQSAVWAAPMILLAPMGGPLEIAALWTMTNCLMAAVAIGFHATPLSAILFLFVVSSASIVMMIHAQSAELVGTVTCFAILILAACLRHARMFGRQFTTATELAEKQQTVSMLLREYDDSGADWLWQTDTARRLTGVTSYFARMMRIDAADIEGKSFLELLAGSSWQSGDFDPALRDLASRLKAREAFANLVLPVEVGGVRRWWELSASPRYDERGAFLGFHGVGSDITVQHEASARIAELARCDQLTKLPNRLHLTEGLAAAIEDMTRWHHSCAFLMIDLDRFKAVNDTLGHQIGDLLLAQVGERLGSVCTSNEICGRLGGDEFAVIIRDVPNPDYVERLAETIIEHVSRPYQIEHHTLYIGASIGSATAPRDGETPDTLIRSADLAMYRAKDGGGGRHFSYIPSLHADAEERRVMEIALRSAIENGELHLEYQPVVDVATGNLASFEALLRWNHPVFGNVSPAKFIPLAEEARLIGPIGEWVLRTACNEAQNWPPHVGVAVNMSAEQFYDPEILTKIVSALSSSGLSPQRLELEVTESIFMRDGNDITRLLDSIMGLGVRLALDDFGTGYSSLGYLSRTRFKTIKIDRSFVVGAAEGKLECVAIVKAVIALAQSLDIKTVAEGVETEEQLKVVCDLGCTKIQGYYFGRPMRAADVLQMLYPRSSNVA